MFYSLKSRLIAFFVVLLVLSFATMSSLIFNESRSIIRSYIESSALEKMDEYGSFISMALTQIYDLSSLVFNSELTKSWNIALSDPGLPEGEKMLANLRLSEFLTQATNSYSGVSSVSVYHKDGLRVTGGNRVASDTSFLEAFWYNDFIRHGKRWVPAHTDPLEASLSKPYQVVSLMLPIGTFEPSPSKNWMKVNISADFLLEPLNRIHLGESGTIFLLDREGDPVLPQREEFNLAKDLLNAKELRNSDKPFGVRYLQNESGTNNIVVYKKLNVNDWLLVGVVPEGDLFAKLNMLRNTIVIFSTALLIAAVLAATWLSYGITKPLSRLASAMRSVQKGDFGLAELRIPPERSVRNEVGYVTATFRNMVVQLRHHIKTEFELKLLRQQAEYKSLLMQINPHFLFNTLELLSSLAMQRRKEDTVKVIDSLGKMLRFSLKMSDDLVPLSEELKYLRHYISILQIRFGERLVISIDEEGRLDKAEIVKFILQPLVENAVKYSFQMQPQAVVAIRVRSEGGRLRLSVRDNGAGMPPELVQRLRADSEAAQFAQMLTGDSRQIGLRNVLARCRLYYGPLFAFAIDSRIGEGTTIELQIPATGGETG